MKAPLNILARFWAYLASFVGIGFLAVAFEAFMPDDDGHREVLYGAYLLLGGVVAVPVLLTIAALVQVVANWVES